MVRSEAGLQTRMYYLDLEKIFKKCVMNNVVLLEQDKSKIQTRFNQLEHRYNSSLLKHRYFKFKNTGPVLYVIDCGLEYADGVSRVKIGIAGVQKSKKIGGCEVCKVCEVCNRDVESKGIDQRLENHRTLWPRLRIFYMIFCDRVELVERVLKEIYKEVINPGGHEIVEGKTTTEIINKTKEVIKMLNTEYRECSEEEIEKYNQNVLTTVKTIKEEVEEVIEEVIEEKQEEVEELKNDILKYQEYLNNLEKYKLVDLIKILEEFGLTKSGNKNVKVDRLREFLQRKLEEEEEEEIKVKKVYERTNIKNEELNTEKRCNECRDMKELSEYRDAVEHRDGKENTCKVCRKLQNERVLEEKRKKLVLPEEKVCKVCIKSMSLEKFVKDNNQVDGYGKKCKECHKSANKARKQTIVSLVQSVIF